VLVAKQAAASYTAGRDERIAQLRLRLSRIESLRAEIREIPVPEDPEPVRA